MTRALDDWLQAYVAYTQGTEAPRLFHFWAGVTAIAGALRKHVWLDMIRFQWVPGSYVILVAPPGVATKTTTMDEAFKLLRKIPGVNFGPDNITWQGLVKRFSECGEMFQYGDTFYPMSALTIGSGELGNLLNPQDNDMVNLLITLWDGKSHFSKETKMSGNETIEAPWINLIGCTTPDWIANNVPASMIGGGFVSRCIFVYQDTKENLVTWPDEMVRKDHDVLQEALVHDLEHIATQLIGPMTLSKEAREWGREWYTKLWTVEAKAASEEQVKGYIARKQGHLVKLSMVLSVSRGDSMVIEKADMQLADVMLKEVEAHYNKVFSKIGRSETSLQAERLLEFVKKVGRIQYSKAFQYIHTFFPDARDFEGIINGLIRAGYVKVDVSQGATPDTMWLVYIGEKT